MRVALIVSAGLVLSACAGADMRVETSGSRPSPEVPIGLAEPDPEAASDVQRQLESRAAQALAASGLALAPGGAAPASGLEMRLGFSVRPEGLGAHVPVDGSPRWAARPQRRGFLQPKRLVYTVDVWLADRATGAETARARASSRQPRGDAPVVLGRLADMAAGALAGGP